ncbi:alanine racemase [Niameybacter massiliensis]|uniref:Alanine racemase n=1 Tax=Holtiella tumoricola TaxID=3018743 RepID=A0AA42J4I4_9FIRM|nr:MULTISPECIES: alanine racemase [Lachnospirales]MDA3734116.1 alanine racemase [Holtiella tumoricola]
MLSLRPRVVAEVSTEAIRHNYHEIRKVIPHNTQIMSIVKADGYGHGAIEIAKIFQDEGADCFAVAIAKEGEELREAGIEKPILVLGYTPAADIEALIQYDLTQTVFSYEMAEFISEEAAKFNKSVNVHIKVDTGMGRIGFLADPQSVEEIKRIATLPNINMEGIFTHFSTADESDPSYTKEQWSIFTGFLNELHEAGIEFPIVHAANSAAVMVHSYAYVNMVRPGIIMYGYYPSDYLFGKKINLQPAMTLKTQVVHVKTLGEGHYIGYGRKFCTPREMKVATIPIGYADGYSRRLSNKGRVLIRGQYANVLGNICMDQFMVDVTHIDDISVGDEVVVFGSQGDKTVSIEELARLTDTINYEIMCMIGKRVPRIYV